SQDAQALGGTGPALGPDAVGRAGIAHTSALSRSLEAIGICLRRQGPPAASSKRLAAAAAASRGRQPAAPRLLPPCPAARLGRHCPQGTHHAPCPPPPPSRRPCGRPRYAPGAPQRGQGTCRAVV